MNEDQQSKRIVSVEGVRVQLNIDESLQASALRALIGSTPTDLEVDSLPIPINPIWLHFAVRALKWYRAKISRRLGQRCVYEPSCSRYAELALRKHGFFRGIHLTAHRLKRCKPGHGGIDVP